MLLELNNKNKFQKKILNLNARLATRLHIFLWFIIWCSLALVSWTCRPLLPFQETQIASITWEMWQSKIFLIPSTNGKIYTQTPPLFNWIEIAIWSLFGVKELLLRLTSACFSFGILLLTALAGYQLWPQEKAIKYCAPLVLIGCFVWILFSTAHIHQTVLVFFHMLCVNCLISVWKNNNTWCWFGVSFSFLGGIFSIGIIFIAYILPLALTYPVWSNFKWIENKNNANKKNRSYTKIWYKRLIFAFALPIFIFLYWVQLVKLTYPELSILQLIGLTQLVDNFNHSSSIGFYISILPFLLFPWGLWPPIYRSFKKMIIDESTVFCFFWLTTLLMVIVFTSDSFIIPILSIYPVISLLIAKAYCQNLNRENYFLIQRYRQKIEKNDSLLIVLLCLLVGIFLSLIPILVKYHQVPSWIKEVSPLWGLGLILFTITFYFQEKIIRLNTLSLMSLALVIAINFGIVQQSSSHYDLTNVSNFIAQLEQQNIPIIHLGRYQSQYHFKGRLTKPLIEITDSKSVYGYLQSVQYEVSPESMIIFYPNQINDELTKNASYFQEFRGGYVAIMQLEKFVAYSLKFKN